MGSATLAKPSRTAPAYEQPRDLPVDFVTSGHFDTEAPADRLRVVKGFALGITLGAGLWAVIISSILFLRH
jgi:hypothetical protein